MIAVLLAELVSMNAQLEQSLRVISTQSIQILVLIVELVQMFVLLVQSTLSKQLLVNKKVEVGILPTSTFLYALDLIFNFLEMPGSP